MEDGETRIHSNITFLRPEVMDDDVLCFATTLSGDVTDTETRVIVKGKEKGSGLRETGRQSRYDF